MTQLIAAEFSKLLSTRLWFWLLLASAGLVALYVSLNIAFADNTVTLPLDSARGQQTLFAIAGAARPLVAVLGAIAITSEFRHKTATATFLATPRRGRVVIAKLVASALVGVAYGVACIATVTAIVLPWLGARGIHVALTGNDVPATLAGVVAAYVIFALIGVALGAVLREQVATVVGLLIYLFVVEPIVTNIPGLDSWTPYLPGPAGSALTQISLATRDFLAPWQGALMLIAYAGALATVGAFLTIRGGGGRGAAAAGGGGGPRGGAARPRAAGARAPPPPPPSSTPTWSSPCPGRRPTS
jgi:ABC-2 type transport system permease protein